MILRVSLLVISLATLLSSSLSAEKSCPEHYAPKYFEERSDELSDIIEEYFIEKGISFPPTQKEIEKLGLKKTSSNVFQLPNSSKIYKELSFPITPGIWNYSHLSSDITETHLLIKEHTRLSEIEAINTYNGLLGSYWNDYKAFGYEMILEPEESRIRYKNVYFELSVNIYGLKNDATGLSATHADLIFRDYSAKVKQYKECKAKE